MLSFKVNKHCHSSANAALCKLQSRHFTKYRKIRYRRIYGNAAKGEPKKMPKTRTKMFVPTHIAHKYDWSPVDRIWAMRASKHDSIDHASFTSLMKETENGIDLLDVVGLSLRKSQRQIEWKPYHSCVALHHLAQIHSVQDNTEESNGKIFNNRYLFDLLEECAMSVSVLKPRFIAQTMWSLDKLNLINNRVLNNRGKICLLKCADELNKNALIHRLEIWNIAECINVLTKHEMYDHALIANLAQRIINMHRDHEWFGINDIPRSYALLAHSFGKIVQYRSSMLSSAQDSVHHIDYTSLCYALLDRFMNDKIYKTADNFEILSFIRGIAHIVHYSEQRGLSLVDSLKTLEHDLHSNMDEMHISDIAVISRAFSRIFNQHVISNGESEWLQTMLDEYLPNVIDCDAFSLLDVDERSDCLHYFVSTLCKVIQADTTEKKEKDHQYYALFSKYMEEVHRVMDIFSENYEKYQDDEKYTEQDYDYQKNGKIMTNLVAMYDALSQFNLKDQQFYLFEQKLFSVLDAFSQSETRLFSQIRWAKLLSVGSNLDLMQVLMRHKTSDEWNPNILKTVFSSLQYHLFDENEADNTRAAIEKDMDSSRQFINKLYHTVSLLYAFQQQQQPRKTDEDDAVQFVSDEMKQYFLDLAVNEYDQKFHILSQSDRKLVLRTLLILQENTAENVEKLLSDINRFDFYKGSKSALLTQEIDDASQTKGYQLGHHILESDIFRNFLQKHNLFISKAFLLGQNEKDNVFQMKNLNEWRFERVRNHKEIHLEPWLEDGHVKGAMFEWRAGGVREGAGLHPTLNDIDLQELEESEHEQVFDVANVFDEDHALLTNDQELDYRRIILRSMCDVLLESNDKEKAPIAIFVNDRHVKSSALYFKHVSDIFQVKCVVIDDIESQTDVNEICNRIKDTAL